MSNRQRKRATAQEAKRYQPAPDVVHACHFDSFSGSLSELKRGLRTVEDGVRVLAIDPQVSVWDRGTPWLERLIADMKAQGLIVEDFNEPYPWCRFNLTDKGRTMLTANAGSRDE
jgi:hypothetical protein